MSNQAAVKVHNERANEAKALLAELTVFVDDNGGVAMENVNWGHAGSMGYVVSQLKEIRSFIRGEEV